jgi:hypothetical protein
VRSLASLQLSQWRRRGGGPIGPRRPVFRIRVFKEPQRPEATHPLFHYATSPGRSCRPGRLESGFCGLWSRSSCRR